MREFSPDRNLLRRAEALTDINRWEEAVPLFTRYLAQEPDSFQANCYLSLCFYHLKNNKEALRYAEAGIRFKPEDEWGHRLRSLALAREKNFKEALDSAKEAVRLAPQEPLAMRRLMNAYLDCKMYDEALQSGEKLRALQPEKEAAYTTMGYIFMQKNQYDAASKLFYQALEINPLDSASLNNLGVISLRQNNNQKASEFFQRAIQAEPQFKMAQENLIRAVNYKPLKKVVPGLIFLTLVGIANPFLLFIPIIILISNYYQNRNFHKLSPALQMFVKSNDAKPQLLAEARRTFNRETVLQLARVFFFFILIVSIIISANLAFVMKADDESFSDSILLFIKDFAILNVINIPIGFLWLYLAKKKKNAEQSDGK